QGEAVKKSQTMTDMFAPFTQIKNDFMKGFAPENFYTPVPLKSNTPIATKTPTPLIPTPLNPNYVAPKTQQGAGTPSTGGYVVKAGDTLGAIAARYGTTPQAIANANGIADVNKIQVGQNLTIGGVPAGGATPTPQGGVNVPTGGAETTTPAGRLTPDELGNLASLAGKAGLTTEAFLSLVQENAATTGAEQDEIRNDLGIPGLVDEAFTKPEKTTVEYYKDLYDTSGLADIKTKVAAIDETINKKRDDLVKATGELNSNPWLSQGTRQGRLKNLQELAYADINNDIQARQQYLDLYDSGVSEIEKQIGYYQTDTTENRQLTVDKLNYLLTEAERVQAANEQDSITAGLRNVPEYLQGILNRESTEAQRELAKIAANKTTVPTTNITGAGSQELSNAFTRSVLGLSKDARGYAQQSYNTLVQQGRVDEAKELILQTAVEGADTETKKKLLGREEALAALDDIRANLNEYEAAGGNTNILKGGWETLQQKLGRTSDPELAEIENDIRISIQAYRQAVSGAAFTESEAKEYEKIFPSISRNAELNTAKLDSLENVYRRNQEVFYKTKLGTQNYDALYGDGALADDVESYLDTIDLDNL
ncbi:LysM peptidoglycan-binding domain-containing protein, partial [Candidatus Falkowbacteria bacterium]|nr:LysM peptidoglycan-binding domain-containing protein [Candidatus Falkowbacteria bacterium]